MTQDKIRNLNLLIQSRPAFYNKELFFLGLENLPKELQKNFNQMRELDTRSQGLDLFKI